MARKTKEESQQTRERILDAAEQIFARRGVGSATIAHIADTARISRGAVYGHYRNKVDICLAMCRRAIERSTIPPHVLKSNTPLDALLHMGMFCMRQWISPGSMQRTLRVLYFLCEDTPENAPLKRLRQSWEKSYERYLRNALRRAVRSGDLPPTLHIARAQSFINCILTGIYNSKTNANLHNLDNWGEVEHTLLIARDALRFSEHLRTLHLSPATAE